MDAFLSHSSVNADAARRIARSLSSAGLSVWVDRANLRVGSLLRSELQQGINSGRVFVLLWSRAARNSPWVKAELLTAFHSNRFILPCLLDGASLPQFLMNSAQLDLRRKGAAPLQELAREVRRAPRHANDVLPVMRHQNDELVRTDDELYELQEKETDAMDAGDVRTAARVHAQVARRLAKARKIWPYDYCLLNITGYHAKNEYLIKHWDENEAG
jgi:hypothetical protein